MCKVEFHLRWCLLSADSWLRYALFGDLKRVGMQSHSSYSNLPYHWNTSLCFMLSRLDKLSLSAPLIPSTPKTTPAKYAEKVKRLLGLDDASNLLSFNIFTLQLNEHSVCLGGTANNRNKFVRRRKCTILFLFYVLLLFFLGSISNQKPPPCFVRIDKKDFLVEQTHVFHFNLRFLDQHYWS